MPSKKQYDLVQNDDYDTRIPLHPEEAFHHGITFQAKVISRPFYFIAPLSDNFEYYTFNPYSYIKRYFPNL